MKAIELKGTNLTQFQELIDAYYTGWSFSKGNVSSGQALNFYAKDPSFIFYDTQPPVEGFQGVESLHKGVQQRAKQGGIEHLQLVPYPGKLRAWRREDVAWTIVPYHVIALRTDGKTTEFDSRQTHIWEMRENQWSIVHEHTAPALPQGWTGLAGSGAFAHPGLKGATDPDLQRFFERYFAAWSNHMTFDPAKAQTPAMFYSSDPGIVLYDPGSALALFGWSALHDFRTSMYRILHSMSIDLKGDICAWKRDDLAWVTFMVCVSLETKVGTRREFLGRQTDILERENDDWQIIHEHLSIPFLG